MKLWEKFKRLMPNRKKKRVKTAVYQPRHELTAAELLIQNNWNIPFNFPPAERKGQQLAYERLKAKQKANEKIPNPTKITRQQKRQQERREFKELRSMVKEHRRKKKQEHLIQP